MAQGEEVPAGELSYGYAAAELQEIVAVFQRLFRVQKVLLKVNMEYIASAAQDERFRVEPPFKLQGSYRNMGKLTEKVVAAMTDEELERLIDDHYQGESQTLTTAAEQNLLKLAELRGRLSPEKAKRWEEIKQGFARVKRMGGKEDDPVARVTGQLGAIEEQLGSVRDALILAAEGAREAREDSGPNPVAEVTPRLEALREAVLEVARVAREAKDVQAPAPVVQVTPGTDLAPYLKHLAQVLKVLAERQEPTPAPAASAVVASSDFKTYMEQLTRAITAMADRPVAIAPALQRAASGPLPADLPKQITLLENALLPLERAAKRSLQSGEESLKAMQVWQAVKEALEVLQAISQRPSL
jgi:hypothetical protein